MNPSGGSGPLFGTVVLTTAYLPPVEYFFAIANSGRVLIEQHEAYQKQSWRNRCRILATGGPEDLSIPVVKEERLSRPIRDIRIDYSEPWLQHHIRAFAAAYHNAAFYDYYADDLIPMLERKPVFLFDLNQSLLEKLLELLNLHVPVSLTDHFCARYSDVAYAREKCSLNATSFVLSHKNVLDGRERIQPKYKGESLLAEYHCEQAYYQVFVNEMPGLARHDGMPSFIPNLSILDLLSAEGPDAASFLRT